MALVIWYCILIFRRDDTMTNQEMLINHISKLSEDEISSLLDAVTIMLRDKEPAPKPACPHCAGQAVIRYGFKCKKQRFLCKNCGHTFVPTTNTIMAYSHFPATVWKEMIADTLQGSAIDFSARRLGLYHQAAFDMRHKILMALQEIPETANVCLEDVSEFDETFVLDCYKGKKLEPKTGRKPRRHGAKASKRGISSEYLCICTGIQRKGNALAATVNRAKPSAKELLHIFEGHIANGTLVLCDGLRSYHALPGIAGCTVRDCMNREGDDAHFFNLNTVNGFHSFIKKRYTFYRGVASKYINRYNALFAAAYRNAESISRRLAETVLTVTATNYYHSNQDVRTVGVLAI